MSQAATLLVGRTADGFRMSLAGRGSIRESRALLDFAAECFADAANRLVIDLAGCDYVDSTFLGSLLAIYKRAGDRPAERMGIVAPPLVRKRLFETSRLDRIFPFLEEAPAFLGAPHALPADISDAETLARHVVECHRLLASLPGPEAEAYRRVATELERQIGPGGGPEPAPAPPSRPPRR